MQTSTAALDAMRDGIRRQLSASGREPTQEEVAEYAARSLSTLGADRAEQVLDPTQLSDALVIAADEAGEYFVGLGARTDISDVVSVVAPPFERFFVDFNIP